MFLSFIGGYYASLALTNVELAKVLGKEVEIPQTMLMTKVNINKLEDGEITLKPLGIAFVGKNKKGKYSKFLFQVCDVERYTTSHYANLLVSMKSCNKKMEKRRQKIRKIVNWYAEISRII